MDDISNGIVNDLKDFLMAFMSLATFSIVAYLIISVVSYFYDKQEINISDLKKAVEIAQCYPECGQLFIEARADNKITVEEYANIRNEYDKQCKRRIMMQLDKN